MSKALIYHNMKCLKCDKIEVTMVKVGPMVFCNECFQDELIGKGLEVDENGYANWGCKIYQTWLAIYKEEASK